MSTFLSGSTLGDHIPTPDEIRFAEVLNEKFTVCEDVFGGRKFRAYCGGGSGYVIRRYEPACMAGVSGGDMLGQYKPISMGPISLGKFFQRHFGMTFTQFLEMPTPDVLVAVRKHQNSLLLTTKPKSAQGTAGGEKVKQEQPSGSKSGKTKTSRQMRPKRPVIVEGEVSNNEHPAIERAHPQGSASDDTDIIVSHLSSIANDTSTEHFAFFQYAGGEMVRRYLDIRDGGKIDILAPLHWAVPKNEFTEGASVSRRGGWIVIGHMPGLLLEKTPHELVGFLRQSGAVYIDEDARITVEEEPPIPTQTKDVTMQELSTQSHGMNASQQSALPQKDTTQQSADIAPEDLDAMNKELESIIALLSKGKTT